MGISIKIGGVDKTEYVDARSLSISDELTSKVNSASFDFICNDIAVVPIPGQTVLIEEGSTKLFSGRILSKTESFLPPNLLKYPVECVDHTRDLDKKLVIETYENQKGGNIIKDIIAKFTSGFTTTNVSDGPTISKIIFDYIQVSEAITKIAEMCGYEWYCDYDKDIHFFFKTDYPAPFQLDDNQANHKDLVINTDVSQLRNSVYVKSSGYEDPYFSEVFIGDGVTESWTCRYTTFACPNKKIGDPGILPTGSGWGISFSHDSLYLAIVYDTSPYVTIYKRDGDTFTKLTNPAILPAGGSRGISFSHDSLYLAIVHDTSPYVTIYKRSGDVFTKLDNPTVLPASTGLGVNFSHDSTYLAVAHATTPYVTIYKRSGDVFTKLDNPAELPAGEGHGVTFSHNNNYLSVAHFFTPFVTTYKRSGDVFMKLSDPDVLPDDDARGVAFSHNDIYLVIIYAKYPYIIIYKREGDTFTKIDDPVVLPAGVTYGVDFSHDSMYLVVAHNNLPYVTIYKQPILSVTSNSVSKTVGWDGIDNPDDYDFMYNYTTKVLSLGTYTSVPADGDEIIIIYGVINITIILRRDDPDSINAVKVIEGGDGIFEFCITDNNIDSLAWANEAAKADLLQNANPIIKGTFVTNRSDIKSGQIITINSTKRNINQNFLVQKVELVRVDVITEYAKIPYKPAAEAVIGYKPAATAEEEYRNVSGSEIIYYIFNITIATNLKKLEDLFLYLLAKADESLK